MVRCGFLKTGERVPVYLDPHDGRMSAVHVVTLYPVGVDIEQDLTEFRGAIGENSKRTRIFDSAEEIGILFDLIKKIRFWNVLLLALLIIFADLTFL